ncbi:isoflavone reductase family protein [Talaromyces proteolyticus]|uniref:Isoflavone reductase family protein n=1 Tax=Talaromyces proteolyticus TaxID=1131652 RepID=A0AAD4Q1J3_9EURO|nr:isoflavone reductase family protein [Talaromyces proteolyticus]KAH8702334.1 isoflavone reductase family protein [Talaromyces proteolyticus]
MATTKTKVLIIGASGETGRSIANGLLEDGGFEVYSFTRPASAQKPQLLDLAKKGLIIRQCDLSAPEEELAEALRGIDVVVSSVGPADQLSQLNIATAAKAAGVKRFVPCAFITVCAPGGIMWLRDEKEKVYNHIKQLKLTYTIIDVGWWYQIATPRLTSGKIDYAMTVANDELVEGGKTPSAFVDLRDIGKYVTRIIVDPRTENKMVFSYNTVTSPEDIFAMVEKMSGEKVERKHVSKETVMARVEEGRAHSETYPFDASKFTLRIAAEYQLSWGIRGDNVPSYAKYLGYLDAKELYPDFKPITLEEYIQELLSGTATGIYTDRISRIY